MKRTGWLAAFALMLAPSMTFAQQQGGMMGGRGGGMGGMMQRQMGGMMQNQMGMMQGGMGGMGGMMMAATGNEVRRAVQVELEGGRRLSGHIELGTVLISADLGQYGILPDKIKVIKFLKPANEVKGNAKEDDDNAVGGAGGAGIPGGPGAGFIPADNQMGNPTTRVKVVTTSDEITGSLDNPTIFRIELGFGSLVPATHKLRSITFTDEERKVEPARPAEGAAALAPEDAGPGGPAESSRTPRYFRQGQSIIVISPVGDQVTMYNLESRKPHTLTLSGSKDSPLHVTPIIGQDLVALGLKGSKIARIAVADTATGTWYPQDLRKPVDGRVTPIIAPGIAVYTIGRDVYAYSGAAHRWDTVELPEGMPVGPVVGMNGATIESHGHIYSFVPKTGKWDHIDVRAILDVVKGEKK
jgi:hypothetical protein